jgi:hypothetical protein
MPKFNLSQSPQELLENYSGGSAAKVGPSLPAESSTEEGHSLAEEDESKDKVGKGPNKFQLAGTKIITTNRIITELSTRRGSIMSGDGEKSWAINMTADGGMRKWSIHTDKEPPKQRRSIFSKDPHDPNRRSKFSKALTKGRSGWTLF